MRNAEGEGATLGIGLDPPNVFLMHLTLHHPPIIGGETSLFYHKLRKFVNVVAER